MSSTRSILKSLAVGADVVRRPAPGAVVLAYHRVGTAGASEIDLPLAAFVAQMRAVAATGCACSLDELTEAIADGDAARITGAVVVTFDDGTADFVDHALPVLVEYGVPATLYASTRFIDEQRPFPWGSPPLSWGALRESSATGLVTIGSHTHSHVLLDRTAPHEVVAELDRSIELISEHVGAPAHFAYPKAFAPDAAADAAVRARFRTAAVAGTRPNVAGHTDLHRLHRSPVQRSDSGAHFAAKLRGGMRLEDDLRRVAARVRSRGATT